MMNFLISCEHGGNAIPAPYRQYFHGCQEVLNSHRGYDLGALQLAHTLAQALNNSCLLVSTTSRLLVDLNRSRHHPQLHSKWIRQASPEIRNEIITEYYLPYRTKAEEILAAAIEQGSRVIHLSCHSFTPVLDGRVRQADIGLLYDPSRPGEAALCQSWQRHLAARLPDLRIRRNYPYKGVADGLVTYLRKRFSFETYIGIEIEVNQKIVIQSPLLWQQVQQALSDSIKEITAA